MLLLVSNDHEMQAINTMYLLWAFDFSPAKNDKGEEVKPDIWNFAQVSHLVFVWRSSSNDYFPGVGKLSEPVPLYC